MRHRGLPFFLAIGLLLPAAHAADPRVHGPISGFIFDPAAGAIRPVVGFPGAALLGDAVISGWDKAEIAPDGKSALAIRNGALYAVYGFDTAAGSDLISDTIPAIDRIVWNGDSSSALLYAAQSHRLFLVTPGLQELDLHGISGEIGGLLLSRTGAMAVIAVGDSLYLASPTAPARLLAPGIRATALTFANSEQDLLVTDAASQQILSIQDFAGAAAVTPFAALPADANVVAMALSADNRFLFAADAAGKAITVYDFSSHASLGPLGLDVAPESLRPLPNNYFLLNSGSPGQPYFLLDGGQTPAVYFVPARKVE